MNKLIVYYSRTGNTKKVAEELANKSGSKIAELIDEKNRSGGIGWLGAGRDALKNKLTSIKPLVEDISKYDLIIFGTPVWAGKMTPALRTFIQNYKDKIKNYAIFTTAGSSSSEPLFVEIKELIGKESKKNISFLSKEIKKDFSQKINEFCSCLH
jgi:flavodoxin